MDPRFSHTINFGFLMDEASKTEVTQAFSRICAKSKFNIIEENDGITRMKIECTSGSELCRSCYTLGTIMAPVIERLGLTLKK